MFAILKYILLLFFHLSFYKYDDDIINKDKRSETN